MSTTAYLDSAESAGYTVLRDLSAITLDPAAARLLPESAAGVGLQVSGDVLLVAVDVVPTPAVASQLERLSGVPLTFALVTTSDLAQLRAAASPSRPGDGPRIAAAALSGAAALAASDLTLMVGRPPQVKVAGASAPMERFARLSDDDVVAAATWLLGDDNDGVVTVGESRWRVTRGTARSVRLLTLHRLPAKPPRLEDLALPAALSEAAQSAHGLILLASRAGGGRTSTAAAVIDRLNSQRQATVVTIEDPVEYQHRPRQSNLVQLQIGIDAPDVTGALAQAASHGADVIQLDITDDITAAAALDQASAGRLVVATIAAPSAADALRRLAGMFEPSQQPRALGDLAATLRVVSAQQLVATQNGLLAVCEVLTGSTALCNLIRQGRWHEIGSAFDDDPAAIPMDRSLAQYVAAGRLSREVARAAAQRTEDFDLYLNHTTAGSRGAGSPRPLRVHANEPVLPQDVPVVTLERTRPRARR